MTAWKLLTSWCPFDFKPCTYCTDLTNKVLKVCLAVTFISAMLKSAQSLMSQVDDAGTAQILSLGIDHARGLPHGGHEGRDAHDWGENVVAGHVLGFHACQCSTGAIDFVQVLNTLKIPKSIVNIVHNGFYVFVQAWRCSFQPRRKILQHLDQLRGSFGVAASRGNKTQNSAACARPRAS